MVISVGRKRALRSLKANAYLWVIYEIIAEWSGHTKEEVHEAMKAKFLPPGEVVLPTGETLPCLGSTRDKDSLAHSEYISDIKNFCRESGLDIPEPDEVEVSL